MKISNLSVFFPLYNEEKNVKPLVAESLEVFPKVAEKFEIILVNDGSTDSTLEVCEKLSKKHQNIRVINQENRGYGGALKTGFNNATYDWVFYSDGDLQFNLSEISDFIEYTDNNDLVIGYRKTRAEGFKRTLIMKLLKIWNFIFFNFPLFIKDIDCAFKLIKKDVLNTVHPLKLDGGLISTELLLKANKAHFKIKQFPVTHKIRMHGSSTGDSSKVIIKAIKETIELLRVLPERFNLLKLSAFWLTFIVILLPVSMSIDYMQNDEYTHYRLVEGFLSGNFALDPYLGATFYTQGLLATLFAKLFSLMHIPVLTFLVSALAVWVVSYLLTKYFKLSLSLAIVSGLLLFLSPLFLYSTWGFMTENYFIFFFIVSFWSFLSFNSVPSFKSLTFTNIMFFLSYGVRQFGLFSFLAATFALFYERKYKWGFYQLAFFIFFVLFHFKIFPQTPQMYDARLSFSNFSDIDGVFTRIYIFGIYLSVFLAPFIISALYSFVKSKPKSLFIFLLVPLMFFIFEKKFEPENVIFTTRTREGNIGYENISTQFPYFKNVFTRKGFYEDNLPGDKYIFPGYFDFFNLLELLGKLLFMFAILLLGLTIKALNKFQLFYTLVFTSVLLVSPRLFDRYLLPLVVTGMFLVAPLIKRDKITQSILYGCLIVWLYLGYQFTADNILVNKYIWNKSLEISREENVNKDKISADHSWRQLYPNPSKKRIYHFTYADFSKSKNSDNYKLISKYKISYPGTFYKEPYVYLYYNSGAVE